MICFPTWVSEQFLPDWPELNPKKLQNISQKISKKGKADADKTASGTKLQRSTASNGWTGEEERI